MDYASLGRKIKNRRLHLGITQENLAEKAGLSTSFIGHIERGDRIASLDSFLNIANALNISPTFLLSESLTISSFADDETMSGLFIKLFEVREMIDSVIGTGEPKNWSL